MHIFDVLEVWAFSMGKAFDSFGVIARFERSSTDRPNPSCSLNLRRDDREADLVVWESGEGELVVGKVNGAINQTHFDDLLRQTDLSKLLSTLVEFVVLSRSK